MKYRPEIDGLRAVAVVPVMLFHAGIAGFGGGFVGVDVFFVISGYLITNILADDLRANSFSIALFYERRARRILPALTVVCFACIPFAWAWMAPGGYVEFSRALASVAVFSSNIVFWKQVDYFSPSVELNPLLHTWSLAVEEQFYVFFPWVLLAVTRLRSGAATPVIAFISLLSLAFAIYAATTHAAANFYLIPSRAWELGIGALLALNSARGGQRIPASSPAGSLLGLALVVYSIAYFSAQTPFPSAYTLLPVMGTALIIRFAGPGDVVGRALRHPVFVGPGLISYSLYLWHQPALAFLRILSLHKPPVLQRLAVLAIAAALALLTWKFVETPFRQRGRISGRTVAQLAVATSGVLIAIGVLGQTTNGFEMATAERAKAAALDLRLTPNFGLSESCDSPLLSEDCRTGEEPEVILWGDSTAMHLADALVASNPNIRLAQFTKSACGPIVGLAPMNAQHPIKWSKECLEFNAQVIAWIQQRKHVKYVVLSSLLSQYTNAGWQYLTPQDVGTANWQLAADFLGQTMKSLEEHGITPVFVSPPPTVGEDIGHCLLRAAVESFEASKCDFSEMDYRRLNAAAIRVIQELERRHRVVWLSEFMCRQGTCRAAEGGLWLYRDEVHLTHEGSAGLGRRIGFFDIVTSASTR